MKNLLMISALAMLSSVAHAADELKGDTLVRSLSVGQASLVLFQNPAGDSARTLVYCLPSEEIAKVVLSDAKMGGIMLIPGSKIILKNDATSSFTDGTRLDGEYIQIQCR